MSKENKGRGQFHSIEGGITFQNVNFHFDPEKSIIKDLSINIGSGEVVGICGPSGAGKTVLTQLMQGLYNPVSGKVFIDGNDLRTINLQHLRSQVALVSGNQYFFEGSIRENMQRVFPNATNDRIIWACNLACVDEDIQILSEGYDSQLTDDASSLSPAVKQKLAIARALIRNPKVLVLDDIFANLDIQNELQILDNISELARGRTLIIISQQIWYLKHCRKIVYMENGEIKQIGSTKEVMSQEGPIKEFSNQQLKVVSNRLQGQHNLIFDEMK
jgi:ATP-binding cassette subfamily B protein|tara:strand:- start:777 stop:1598 length:822 start_codon:yes stop_codon:yes gene_type:complete